MKSVSTASKPKITFVQHMDATVALVKKAIQSIQNNTAGALAQDLIIVELKQALIFKAEYLERKPKIKAKYQSASNAIRKIAGAVQASDALEMVEILSEAVKTLESVRDQTNHFEKRGHQLVDVLVSSDPIAFPERFATIAPPLAKKDVAAIIGIIIAAVTEAPKEDIGACQQLLAKQAIELGYNALIATNYKAAEKLEKVTHDAMKEMSNISPSESLSVELNRILFDYTNSLRKEFSIARESKASSHAREPSLLSSMMKGQKGKARVFLTAGPSRARSTSCVSTAFGAKSDTATRRLSLNGDAQAAPSIQQRRSVSQLPAPVEWVERSASASDIPSTHVNR